MGRKNLFQKAREHAVTKATAARASKRNSAYGTLPIFSPACAMCGRQSSQQSHCCTFSSFCPVFPQRCVMCKPFFSCFRPVFRPPCLLRRRDRLAFALVCFSGCREVEASASESAPTPNVQQKGEKPSTVPFSTCFQPVFRTPCLLRGRDVLTLALVCSKGRKGTEATPSESARTSNVEQKGEKPKNLCNKCCSSFKSINGHGTLPLSSPSSEMRGELSDRPSYECCFSTFRPSVPQYWYLCKPSSTCFRPVFALPASFAAAAGIPLRLFARQVNVNQVQGFSNPEHDVLQGFNE